MPDGYVICATPRTGSTLLCGLLRSTGKTGRPDSYYHRPGIMSGWATKWNLPHRDTMTERDFDVAYLRAAIGAGRGETAIFGLRLMRDYLDALSTVLDRIFPGLRSDVERLERAFGNVLYIHLTRVDKLAQAVSLVRAEQSGLWHIAPDGTEIERLGEPKDPYYDFEWIGRELATIEIDDAAWNDWFQRQGVTPLRVEYEMLSRNPAEILGRICQALAVDGPGAEAVSPAVAKLADDISLDWMNRFRIDIAAAT